MGSYVDFQLFRFSGFPSPHPTPSGLPAVYQPKRRIRSRWLSTFRRISTQPCQQAGIFLCGPKGSEMEENEVKKIKQLFRKGVALALAAVTTLSVLPAATVSAASQRATITFAYCYDGNGNTIRYQQTASHNGVTFSHAGEARTRIYADGDNAYCIEPGISLHTGNTLEKDN